MREKMSVAASGCAAAACLISVFAGSGGTAGAKRSGMDIDPTAEIHPTVILEGKVTVGAYTKIDSGTIITDRDRIDYFGLLPHGWTSFEAANFEARIRRQKGL